MTTTKYEIEATGGQYLRMTMRDATSDTVYDVLRVAADYIGEEGEIECWDDGCVVLGRLVARPIND